MSIKRVEEKQDKILEYINEINVTLAKQEKEISFHIHRTSIAEENIIILRQEIDPLKERYKLFNGFFKTFGVFGSIISILYGLSKLYLLFFR